MLTPDNLKYTNDHEWVKVKNEIATIGITDFAQSELGDVVYIEVDVLNQKLKKEEIFGAIEAVKTVSDLFMPVSGEIIEVNDYIIDNPEEVNNDPYGKGWIIKVKISSISELDELLNSDDYEKIIAV
ncbi:MAG: glycine cleavage system protein GcvH [Flavobacteriaceae bacterium]|nr:glycine cleavage system protein GcvH [Flavobacteriaceae bacterium]